MAAIIVLGPLIVGLGVMAALTYPEIAVVPMLVILGAGALILPVVLYPGVVHDVAGARHRHASRDDRRFRPARTGSLTPPAVRAGNA